MKKHEIFFSIIKLPIDFFIVFISFFIARDLRLNHDLPYIVLPKQYISERELFYFALFGSILYILIFSIHSLYKMRITSSKLKEFFDIIFYSFYFFIFFSASVYFARDFLYSKELPRLIILFTTIISIILSIFSRLIINFTQNKLMELGFLERRKILLISNKNDEDLEEILEDIEKTGVYEIIGYINKEKLNSNLEYIGGEKEILEIMKNLEVDEILYIDSDFSDEEKYEIWDYSRIFGIRYRYITNSFDVTKANTEVNLLYKIPVIEIKNTPLDAWGRVLKRLADILGSFVGIVIFSPIMLLIMLSIKIEDPKGPAIYKNRRVGQNYSEFNLYKFRYMKWEYCIKDSYGIDSKNDEALKYEKELIKKRSTRNGPLYKIKDDPRKTKIGSFIEKYSLDELPQFFNVIIGNMSLVGPRPHQPREVDKYEDYQKRVVTIKPGITGMAQVNGREKNDFDNEVKLDVFYIENWSLLLDVKILAKTLISIIKR